MQAMIIDKNDRTRNYISNLFKRTDIETLNYHDTIYALDDIYNKRVDPFIIYLDAMENTMDAIQFIEIISKQEGFKQIPVVVLISDKTSYAVETRLKENAFGLIRKPLNADDVIKVLEKVYYLSHVG